MSCAPGGTTAVHAPIKKYHKKTVLAARRGGRNRWCQLIPGPTRWLTSIGDCHDDWELPVALSIVDTVAGDEHITYREAHKV